MEDVSTMRPAALFFKWGKAALMLNSIPLRLVANTSSQALSLISSNFTGGKMPAFAQRMSTPPNSAATVAMASSISPCSLTSPRQNIAVLPRPRRASTVAAPSDSFRPSTQTRAPCWAKTPAMPLPMPLVPPVTMTDLFLIDVSTKSSLFIGSVFASGGLFWKALTIKHSDRQAANVARNVDVQIIHDGRAQSEGRFAEALWLGQHESLSTSPQLEHPRKTHKRARVVGESS